jgi:hypothetical protein
VPVTAYLTGDIDVLPKRVLFRTERGTENELGSVEITSGTGKAFQIREVSTDVPNLETELVSREEGKHYSVVARLGPNVSRGQLRGNIIIHTDNALQPKIEVPVYGTVN